MDTLIELKDGIQKLKKISGSTRTDENLAAAVHIKNKHRLDSDKALAQSSEGANDHGIDAWFLDEKTGDLWIYQSKMSESKPTVVAGLRDLSRAVEWLEQAAVVGKLDAQITNHCLYELHRELGIKRKAIRYIKLALVSLLSENRLLESLEYQDLERGLSQSRLNAAMADEGVKITVKLEEFNTDETAPLHHASYSIKVLSDSKLILRENAFMTLAYTNLYDLVVLYRRRGSQLFAKNIRLSLTEFKEPKARLVKPMTATLQAICSNKSSDFPPMIFAFYHVGVTVIASANIPDGEQSQLESPNIVNGCQTITIANLFLVDLERKKDAAAIEKFKQIQVVAKIVTGVSDAEVHEITVANNRQTPIENWQLFSNDIVHIQIESSLKGIGVFYERQKGAFREIATRTDSHRDYWRTNNSFVTVEDLGQVVALAKRELPAAIRKADIFQNKETHDKIISADIEKYPYDILTCFNLLKALRRGLEKYLTEKAAHSATENLIALSKNQTFRFIIYYLALVYVYQREEAFDHLQIDRLSKKAAPSLVEKLESVFQKVVLKTREFYLAESRNLDQNVPFKKVEQFIETTSNEIGISRSGPFPFSPSAIHWVDVLKANGKDV